MALYEENLNLKEIINKNISQIMEILQEHSGKIDNNAMDISSVNITVGRNVIDIETYHPTHQLLKSISMHL